MDAERDLRLAMEDMMNRSFSFRSSGTIAALALMLAVLAPAALHADSWYIAASANASGNAGTNWRTDVRIINTSDEDASVRIYLLRNGENNGALDEFTDFDVPAMGQILIQNILNTHFNYSGTGALLVESDDCGHTCKATRKFNARNRRNASPGSGNTRPFHSN